MRLPLIASLFIIGSCLAFQPPSALERIEALGSLEDEDSAFQQLLEPDADFSPMHVPQFGDWLANHYEKGQSFEAYTKSGFNRPSAQRKVIYLLPIGDFNSDSSPALEDLKSYAEAYFQLDVRIMPAVTLETAAVKSRISEVTDKRQLLTSSVLAFLKTQLPTDAYCLLGLTMEDLYPAPDWNYVFGQATLAERVGIYSFARYDPQFFGRARPDDYRQTILKRSCKVLSHETGHMFGLRHCIHFECLMNGSNNLGEMDIAPQYLCPICLRKMHFNVRFDAAARYRELAKFYETHGWDEDLQWTRHQLEKLDAH
jgi:archaemetzincin